MSLKFASFGRIYLICSPLKWLTLDSFGGGLHSRTAFWFTNMNIDIYINTTTLCFDCWYRSDDVSADGTPLHRRTSVQRRANRKFCRPDMRSRAAERQHPVGAERQHNFVAVGKEAWHWTDQRWTAADRCL